MDSQRACIQINRATVQDGTLKLHGASYYNFYAALSIGCVALWVFVARRYKEKAYFQGEAPIAEVKAESTASA